MVNVCEIDMESLNGGLFTFYTNTLNSLKLPNALSANANRISFRYTLFFSSFFFDESFEIESSYILDAFAVYSIHSAKKVFVCQKQCSRTQCERVLKAIE